jgi:hypothetical protein
MVTGFEVVVSIIVWPKTVISVSDDLVSETYGAVLHTGFAERQTVAANHPPRQ